jgi:hypothetical protein
VRKGYRHQATGIRSFFLKPETCSLMPSPQRLILVEQSDTP